MADITSTAAAIVSGVSVAVATLSLGVSAWVARRDRPHLRVRLVPSIGGPGGTLYAQLEAANDGRYAEVLHDLGLITSVGLKVAFGPHSSCFGRLPARLEPGEAFSAFISADELHEKWIESGLKSATIAGVYAQCASGRTYRGPGRFDLSVFARSGHLPSEEEIAEHRRARLGGWRRR